MARFIAVDVGFACLKATDGKRLLLEASAVAPNLSLIQGLKGVKTYTPDLTVDDEDESEWMVGDLAVRQSPDTATWSNLAERDDDPTFRKLLRAALGYLCENNESISLVTGLPVSQFIAVRQKFGMALKDKRMTVTLSVNGNKETKRIHIEKVTVWPQPYGAHLYLALKEDGTDNPDAEATGYRAAKKLIVDVGGGTIDILAVEGDEPKRNIAGTIRGSMNAAYSSVAQVLAVPAIEVETAYLSGDNQVVPLVEQQIVLLANKTASYVANLLNATLYRPEVLLVTGGASEVVGPMIHNALGKLGRLYTCPDTANVEGFLRGAKS